MSRDPAFDVSTDTDPNDILLVGTADVGVAGLTAVDYVTTQADATQIGHLATRHLPDITPFTDGVPRRPIRLYNVGENVTVCVCELSLPPWVSELVSEELLAWASETGVETIAAVFGGAYPHAEEDHTVSYVGTEPFREEAMADLPFEPLSAGYFDGLLGELLTAGLDEPEPAVGALVTPAHPPGPDIDAAVRLVEAAETAYGVGVETTELRNRSAAQRQYYEALAERMAALRNEGSDRPYDDRMFM
ncbi:proteasome assembly chaperone family protein [Halosegnis longus]|uniref:proteasome assembly chaperone family protein n=1 Tax=Halosegnis longus TaxID=2216012 RepID=UPI00129E1D6E|nr:PAC2 family protein [Halosegnis longus]